MVVKMSQVQFNHGDFPTFSIGDSTSDSHHFRRAIKEVVGVCKLRMIVFAFLQALSPVELVKEEFDAELEQTLTTLKSMNSRGRVHPAVSRSLRLQFLQEMPGEVFTGELIVAKGDGTLEVALVDGDTGDLVSCGPGTSGKIEIVPVEGNFDSSRKNWTLEDFNSKIVVDEDGRNSLLGKSPYLNLQEGNAPVCGIKFNHTRKWMKKSEFRLGARFADQLNAIRIREAVSEPFIVKDRRGKTKKRSLPSPTDEVWRLKNIRKGGAFHNRLAKNNILTVEDFLIEFLKNPERLQDILRNMSNDMWKTTLDHALKCQLNTRKYLYTPPESEQKFTTVFNAINGVIGLYSGGYFTSIESLSEHQKGYAHAHTLMETAFENWEKVLKFDDDTSCSSNPCLSYPTNDLAAPAIAFCNSELQHDENNDALSNLTSQPDLSRDLQRQLQIFGPGDQPNHGSEMPQTSATEILSCAIARFNASSLQDTDGCSQCLDIIRQLLSSDDILENCEQVSHVDPQFAPINLQAAHSDENWSDMVAEYMQKDNGTSAPDIHSLSLDAGPSSSTCHKMQHNENVNPVQNLVSDPGNLIRGMEEHLQFVTLENTSQSCQQELDIEQQSAGVTNNSLGVAAIPKRCKGWAKMSSLVRWFSLKKASTLKRLHIAKKRRLY